jgi:hypothetical protein
VKSLALYSMLAFAAAPLAAQQNVSAQLAGRVTPEVAAAVRTLADSAARAGLPVDPLVQKAIEGGAKGVPAAQIIAALGAVFGRLDVAATAIRAAGVELPDAETIVAGAFAASAGIPSSGVSSLVRAGTEKAPAAALLRVAGTLAAIGVPAPQVVSLLVATARSGGDVTAVLDLPARVESAIARGVTPVQAAEGLARAAAHGGLPQSPGGDRGKSGSHRP